jgi:hypothetical protein
VRKPCMLVWREGGTRQTVRCPPAQGGQGEVVGAGRNMVRWMGVGKWVMWRSVGWYCKQVWCVSCYTHMQLSGPLLPHISRLYRLLPPTSAPMPSTQCSVLSAQCSCPPPPFLPSARCSVRMSHPHSPLQSRRTSGWSTMRPSFLRKWARVWCTLISASTYLQQQQRQRQRQRQRQAGRQAGRQAETHSIGGAYTR